jgi:TPP-dependent pyruvate/acetoin dehydrogenase alpha subunit
LLADGVSEGELDDADERAAEMVEAAVDFALASPEPPVDRLAVGMYAPGSTEQFERMLLGSPFGERELVFETGLGA